MLSYFHLDLNDRRQEKKRGRGISDTWLDVRKRGGGVIQMCTVCNRGGGGWGGGSKNGGKMRM